MTAPRRIGVLGGMGPAATILLMQRLMAAVAGDDDASHIPLIVDNNTQVPSRIDRLILGVGVDPAPVLADMARRLEDAGAEALAMPCNTAHHYAPQIRGAVDIPFIDMVRLSVSAARVEAGAGGRIGILGSPALRRISLFEAALGEEGLQALYPADEAALLAAIRSIKAGEPTQEAISAVDAAARGLVADGADLCLIACSEFSMIRAELDRRMPLIDTLDVLVDGIRAFAFAFPTSMPVQCGPVMADAQGSLI